MKTILFAALAATALVAYAGEDSTDKARISGTGHAFYEAPCGTAMFTGQVYDDERMPCDARGAAAASGEPFSTEEKETAGRTHKRDASTGGTQSSPAPQQGK